MHSQVLLFDLDGTLLQSDNCISDRTLDTIRKCREAGYLVGVATSRREGSALPLVAGLCPDIIISSNGALIRYRGVYLHREEYTPEETCAMLRRAEQVLGADCKITIDTVQQGYCNYRDDSQSPCIYTDFRDFQGSALRMCAELHCTEKAAAFASGIADCSWLKFRGGTWYQFAKKATTKDGAVVRLCEKCNFSPKEITAFGDDLADIGMLKLCGRGIAMGNALALVKHAADLVIGGNDEEGISAYLAEHILRAG